MAAIRPCTGTTADWKAVEGTLILKEREIGVEIDTSGHYQIRQGKHLSHKLLTAFQEALKINMFLYKAET